TVRGPDGDSPERCPSRCVARQSTPELGEMIGDFLHLLADGAFFSGTIPPWLAEENTNANIQGLIDEQRNATGIVPGSRHLVLERCRDEIGVRIFFCQPRGN
ncbi:hypothetical protein ACUOFC_52785, partial [Escherichia sp. TWPC-MK]